jgi:hypothetical protein
VWVMAPGGGFLSAVQSKTEPDTIVIRARDKDDLIDLAGRVPRKVQVITDEGTDYPARVKLTRAEWVAACAQMAADVTYTNYKDHVEAVHGKRRHDVYARIWGVLLSLERGRRRGRGRSRGGHARQESFGSWDVFPNA